MNKHDLLYNLPDIAIINDETWPDYKLKTWIPDKTYIILGQSNSIENSIHREHVNEDKVCILKRPSGGEAVILTPKTLVISSRIASEKLENPVIYFNTANRKIIQILEKSGVRQLAQKGISDIAIGDKKIVGSSIYRKNNLVFFHAVLNVAEDTLLMERYLSHPKKEPDYRMGRNHSQFVTSLLQAGYPFEINTLAKYVEE
ncbi:hypothetical protein ACFLRI_04660 [Bacteroidota bacterium]